MLSDLLIHKSELLEIKDFQSTDKCVEMVMSVNCCHSWTDDLPDTFSVLEKKLPSVLETKCFNDWDLPFAEEVKATSTGHLFEHIALDYLCFEKVIAGYPTATFRGHTSWDWNKYPEGHFLICLEMPKEDQKLLSSALPKSIQLIEKILRS
jgi:hypothetical protein